MEFQNSLIKDNGRSFSTTIAGDMKTSRDMLDEIVEAYAQHELHINLVDLFPTEYGLEIEAETLSPIYVAGISEWEQLFIDTLSKEPSCECDTGEGCECGSQAFKDFMEDASDEMQEQANEIIDKEIAALKEKYPELPADLLTYLDDRFDQVFASGITTFADFMEKTEDADGE